MGIFSLVKFFGMTPCYALAGLSTSVVVRNPVTKQRLLARMLYHYLVAMGPIYMKIGQIMATRTDLLPKAWTDELQELQDRAPSMNQKDALRLIRKECGGSIEDRFESVSLEPIASASIAQVHRARLKDGTDVAIKLVKKGVREDIQRNIAAIRLCLTVAHYLLPSVRRLGITDRFNELALLMQTQADMRQEMLRQEEIGNNFKGHPYVRTPALVKELCTDRMLVMEYIDGIRGRDFAQTRIPAAKLAQRLQDSIYTMLYLHGVCHGDPHPGNMFFSKDGEITLVDFGITVSLTEDEKWGLSSFYYACSRKEWTIAVERFTEHVVIDTETVRHNWSAYVAEMAEVFKLHFDTKSDRWSTISYFRDVNEVLKKFGARYSANFTKVELVFLSCEGFASQIDPSIDIWDNARKFTDRYSPYMSTAVKEKFDVYFEKQIPKSLAMRDAAGDYIVAPTHIHRFFFPSTYPLFVERAYRGRLRDIDGNEYVDLSGGYGPHILGYAHEIVTDAICQGARMGLVNAIGNEPELELAKAITDAFPGSDKAILCNSGTEAVMMAIRLCKAHRRKDRVAKFEGHYHGWSDQGLVSSWLRFTGSKREPKPIYGSRGSSEHTVQSTLVLQYGDIEGLQRLRREAQELACVILEPMPSAGAAYDLEFLRALRALCTELSLPLIFDEVVSGFRVAYGGAQTLAGVVPDLTCLGKIIGAGLPCGSVVGRQEIIDIAKSSQDPFFDYEHKAFVGGTMSGNSLTCKAGASVLKYLREHPEIYSRLEKNTNWLADQFRSAAKRVAVPVQVSGNRSIFSITFSYKPLRLYREKQAGSNFKANVALAYYMRKHDVYMPELHTMFLSDAHTEQDLEMVAGAFESSLKDMLGDGLFVT